MSKKTWTKKELDSFKTKIHNKRLVLAEDLRELKEKADTMLKNSSSNALYSSHMADASSDHVEMEKAYYMLAREKKYLRYLDKAIRMIDDGTFGICVSCNELINKDRLEEVPHTQKCFDCKSNSN
tara:strand:- start:66 stop:440 length:375 start_codon:yes stop_codon:yes gene_type:complete